MKYPWLLNEMPIEIKKKTKVIIVGNSGKLKNSRKGGWIDSHDIVIRFSNAITKGHELDVGHRETFRFLCYPAAPDKKTDFESSLREKHICVMSGNLQRLLSAIVKMINFNHLYIMDLSFLSANMNWFNHELSGYYQSKSPKPATYNNQATPSLGLHAILAITQHCAPDVIGFDFFSGPTEEHHYFENFDGMDPNTYHDWGLEADLVKMFHDKGIIKLHGM